MIASLPMYDWPEIAGETDRFWGLIRQRLCQDGIDAPAHLDRQTDPWAVWQDPTLVLAQTCGMPYRTRLHGRVALVGTPDYGLPDAPPGYYYSAIVARREDTGPLSAFRDRVLAYNDAISQSGWAAVQNLAAESGFAFSRLLLTGAHRSSAEAVADGRADLAAIDAVTWRLIETYRPAIAERLHIICRTDPTPGLPLITALSRDPASVAAAVRQAIADLPTDDRQALGLAGLVAIPAEAYLAVPNPPSPQSAGGTAPS